MKKLNLAVANEIKIDKNIAMRRSSQARYPFRQMAIGDSFLFPSGYAVAHYYGMAREFTKCCTVENDRKVFKTKKTPEGYRCWRVE